MDPGRVADGERAVREAVIADIDEIRPPGGLPSGGLVYRREALRIPAVAAVAACFRRFSEQFQPEPEPDA